MSRKCSTCQHVKRAEIDRRLAAGEPNNQIAQDYGISPSSLHRHRSNCLGLASSNAIMKETARGTAAVACLPSKDDLNRSYFDLLDQVDEIVAQAKAEVTPLWVRPAGDPGQCRGPDQRHCRGQSGRPTPH